jgi:hypothetical protein
MPVLFLTQEGTVDKRDSLIDMAMESGWSEPQRAARLAEVESPPWHYADSDSAHWTWFVPDAIREDWPNLPVQTKLMIYLTAQIGADRINGIGALDR